MPVEPRPGCANDKPPLKPLQVPSSASVGGAGGLMKKYYSESEVKK